MKRTVVLVIITFWMMTGQSNAQNDSTSTIGWRPQVESVWMEGLVLPFWPVLGAGIDVDLFRNSIVDQDRLHSSAGIRFWYGTGTDVEHFADKYGTRAYYDADALLQGVVTQGRFFASVQTGYSYRRWPDRPPEYSGSRVKTGIELNYMIYQNRIALRLRAMGSLWGPDDEIEWGPVSLGIAMGWFRGN